MDYHKKRVLTQGVHYLQNNLSLTRDFLVKLRDNKLLTSEEVVTIEKDETPSGKVLELVCALKRRDTRTFEKFVELLENKHPQCTSMLKNGEGLFPDSRTLKYLEEQFREKRIPSLTLQVVSENVMLKCVHLDLMANQRQWLISEGMLPKTGGLARQISDPASPKSPAATPSGRRLPSHRDKSATKTPTLTREEELQTLLDEKQVIIERKDEEYAALNRQKIEMYKEYHSISDQNETLLQAVADLHKSLEVAQSRQPIAPPQHVDADTSSNSSENSDNNDKTSKDIDEVMADLKSKLETTETANKELLQTIAKKDRELDAMEKRISEVTEKENTFKEKLGLARDAKEAEVQEKISELEAVNRTGKSKYEHVKLQLQKALRERQQLEYEKTSLTREKERLEFEKRQQQATMKRMQNMIRNPSVVKQLHQLNPDNNASRTKPRRTLSVAVGHDDIVEGINCARSTQYCLFCHSEYVPLRHNKCIVHYYAYKGNKWGCCGQESHRAPGCIELPHLFIQITVDRKIMLTNGAMFFDLKTTLKSKVLPAI